MILIELLIMTLPATILTVVLRYVTREVVFIAAFSGIATSIVIYSVDYFVSGEFDPNFRNTIPLTTVVAFHYSLIVYFVVRAIEILRQG